MQKDTREEFDDLWVSGKSVDREIIGIKHYTVQQIAETAY